MKKIFSLVALLFICSVVYANPPMGNADIMEFSSEHQQQMKQDFDKISQELKLTNEQKEQIKNMMKSDIAVKSDIRKQIKEKSIAIDQELLKEKYDMNVINKLIDEIQVLKSKISKMNIAKKIQMRSILTLDQYKKMEENRKQMMNKFNKNHKI